jgi:hypothetical protein
LCGGTLISARTILTAAHCVTDRTGYIVQASTAQAYLGVFDNKNLNAPLPVSKIIRVRARFVLLLRNELYFQNVLKHPDYDDNLLLNDIALIILSAPVTFNENIQISCLPSQSNSYPAVDSSGYAVGWVISTRFYKNRCSICLILALFSGSQ